MSECGSRGPRIGSEGTPVCRRIAGHDGPHRPAPGDGWGEVTWNDFPPRPAAPDATAGDGLREEFRKLLFWGVDTGKAAEAADALLALPALRDVLAAAARDAEKVARVTELADEFSAGADVQGQLYDGAYVADVFRAALDPS